MTRTVPVKLQPSTKAELDSLKIHPRETYDDVVLRALDALKKQNNCEVDNTRIKSEEVKQWKQ